MGTLTCEPSPNSSLLREAVTPGSSLPNARPYNHADQNPDGEITFKKSQAFRLKRRRGDGWY